MIRIVTFDGRHADGIARLCIAEGWESWSDKDAIKALSAPGVIAVVAENEGDVVGVAQLLTDQQVTAYLALLVVAESARQRGIGRALIRELFVRSGLGRMDLLAEETSVPFYESMHHKRKPGYRLCKDAP